MITLEQAKAISLPDLLERLGYLPSPQHGSAAELMYLSPLREERTPSFSVNRSKGLWFDHGLGLGGDIVSFLQRLEELSFPDALKRIEQIMGSSYQPTPIKVASAPRKSEQQSKILSIGPVESKSLLNYLLSRGIEPTLVEPYVSEVHYQRGDKQYFALGFANDSGGYETRTQKFKGSLGRKDISTIVGDATQVWLCEGWFDALTHICRSDGKLVGSLIVCNSVGMKDRAIQKIKELQPVVINLYADADPAGEQLVQDIRDALPDISLVDWSSLYRDCGHKDLNEWHAANQPHRAN